MIFKVTGGWIHYVSYSSLYFAQTTSQLVRNICIKCCECILTSSNPSACVMVFFSVFSPNQVTFFLGWWALVVVIIIILISKIKHLSSCVSWMLRLIWWKWKDMVSFHMAHKFSISVRSSIPNLKVQILKLPPSTTYICETGQESSSPMLWIRRSIVILHMF